MCQAPGTSLSFTNCAAVDRRHKAQSACKPCSSLDILVKLPLVSLDYWQLTSGCLTNTQAENRAYTLMLPRKCFDLALLLQLLLL